MGEDRRQAVRRVFMEVADLPSGERTAALERACGGDRTLRAEVAALLAADESAGGFLAQPTCELPAVAAVAAPLDGDGKPGGWKDRAGEQPGQSIGRYKLLERLGEGGFGVVWAVEQREPVKRRVALKIIKLGMDTRQVIARFEAERQALAMMDHPNIAKVLDAGSTESGRPYFVMELVRGVPIVEYCDTERLDTRQRLELFIQVCNAIQHAHQKGVIHRDIKPSNVLVTLHDGRPVPKVIDFGIAKATNQELTEKTIYTQHRQMIGTPAYMSPEQAEMSGLDIDTRSDIYSLGVLLYELLTGTTPVSHEALMSQGFAEIMRVIREVEPPRPSTRTATLGATGTQVAARRHVASPQQLGLLLEGDLDWIVMKCLEKDRTRRYDTANGLSADIRRHLDDEPVLAGPPTASYRLGKLVRRHRGAFTAAAVVFAVLLLGVVATGIGLAAALRAKAGEAEQRRVAEQRFALAERYVGSISDQVYPGVRDLVGASTPLKALTSATSDFLEGLAVDSSDAPELRFTTVRALVRLAAAQGNQFAGNGATDFGKSLATLERARTLLASLPADYPNEKHHFALHYSIEDAIGAAQLASDPKAALATYLALEAECKARRAEDQTVTALPDAYGRPDSVDGIGLLNFRIGHVYGALGDHATQLARYEATALPAIAAGLDVETAPYQEVHDLSVCHDLMANGLRNVGRLEEAREHVFKQLAIDRITVARWPNHARAARDLVDTLGACALIVAETGRAGELDGLLEEALGLSKSLVVRDPENGQFRLYFVRTALTCGEACRVASESATVGKERLARLRRAVEFWSLAIDGEAIQSDSALAKLCAEDIAAARSKREQALRAIAQLEGAGAAGSSG